MASSPDLRGVEGTADGGRDEMAVLSSRTPWYKCMERGELEHLEMLYQLLRWNLCWRQLKKWNVSELMAFFFFLMKVVSHTHHPSGGDCLLGWAVEFVEFVHSGAIQVV
jgi:hypothetical protein